MDRQNMKVFTWLFLYFIAAESFADVDYNAMLSEIRSKPEYVLLLKKETRLLRKKLVIYIMKVTVLLRFRLRRFTGMKKPECREI